MRIAILGDEISPGSAPKLMGQPVRGLKELGIDCEVVMIIDKPGWQQYRRLFDFHLEGVNIRYLFKHFPRWVQRFNFKFPGMSFFSLHHIASWLWAYRGIEEGEFDLIIAHCQYTGLAAANIKARRGIPYVLLLWDPSTFTARKIYKRRFGWKYPVLYAGAWLLDRLAMHGPSALITSGRFHHKHFRALTGKPIEILAPGCFVRESLPDFSLRTRTIITYDRWDIGNTPEALLDLLGRLSHKDVRLVIGGFWHPASLRDDFEREVRARGLQARVEVRGPLDEPMIMKLCSEAMVHIHPVHEAFGMQSLEAAACGCPIIIPRGSGVTDLFEHGVHGYFPDAGDPGQLLAYTEKIFSDRETTRRMGAAAWAAAKQYDWAHHAQALSRICRRYARARPKSLAKGGQL